MRRQIAAFLDASIYTLLLAVVALTPLIFSPLTTEFYELPKLIFLITVVLVLITLWTFSWVVRGKVSVTRTPLDIPMLILLVVILLSAFFASPRYISFVGNLPRLHGSAITWAAYILFYFVAASNLRNAAQIKVMFYTLIGSTVIISLLSLLSYFGLYLPVDFAKSMNFTPAGSSFSASSLMVLVLPLLLISLLHPNKFMPVPVSLGLASLFGICIALTGGLGAGVAAVLGVVLTIIVTRPSQLQRRAVFLAVPVVISVITYGATFMPPLKAKADNFPQEIQLPVQTSWKIATSALGDRPFLGTGPSTFLFNFTAYRPLDFNGSKFWNLRFDTAFNEYLQFFGTSGLLGLVALAFISVVVLNFGWKGMRQIDDMVVVSLSISSILVVVMMLFHATTPVMIVASFAVLAMLMGVHKSVSGKVEELSIGIRASKLTDSNLIVGDVLPVIIFIPILILTIAGVWNTYVQVLADYKHRNALNNASQQGKALDVYNTLVQAENLNPRADLYRADLAQTNFALANAIAAAKGPNEASPGGSLTDQDKQSIQQFLSQSIGEAQAAVALSPRNPQNWEILASIYRQISGVAQNALAFSLNAYGRAIERDPFNPLLRINAGGVYYSIKNYDLAIRLFSDAINLKPDYANGYYNLAVALRDKGDIQNAQAAAERVVSLVDPKSPDYQVATKFLADIKDKTATLSAQTQNLTNPGSQNGALENKNLPDVVNLPPTEVATPPAVPRRGASPSPAASAAAASQAPAASTAP